MTCHIVTKNSKHIKTSTITAEQYLRNQLTQHTDDPVDRILRQYETFSTDKVHSNNSNKRREETHVNRTHRNKYSDIQISDTQYILALQQQTLKQLDINHMGIEKPNY